MDFFAHQARARKRSIWLIVLFVLSVLLLVASVDAVLWRLILWRAKGGAPGVWPLRWDDRALAFAPIEGNQQHRRTSLEMAVPRL